MKNLIITAILISLLTVGAFAQSTEFTYQGLLLNNSLPPTANYDFEFSLWDSLAGGNQQGTTQSVTGVAVANGIFTVNLNFGAQFPGAARFIQIAVRPSLPPGGTYTTLAPRQPFASAPYSIRSGNSGSSDSLSPSCNLCVVDSHILSLSSTKLSGTISDSQVTDNLTINGGTINNTVIGGTTPTFAAFSSITANAFLTLSDSAGTDTIIGEEALQRNSSATETFSFRNAGPGTMRILVDKTPSATEPSYSFTTDTDTGIFSSSENTLNFSTGGVSRMNISGNNTTMSGNLVAVSFIGDGSGLTNVTAASTANLVAASSVVSDAEVDDNLTINGGTINNTVIGGTTPAAGTFTTITGNGSGLTNVTAANLIAASSVVSNAEVDDNLTINGGTINNTVIGGTTPSGGTFTALSANSVNSVTGYQINAQNILGNPGSGNLFAGVGAGGANTTGSNNSFLGRAAGSANTGGGSNTFVGHTAGDTNTTGSSNTIIGQGADVGSDNLSFATAIGAGAVVDANSTVRIGRPADTVELPGLVRTTTPIVGGAANIRLDGSDTTPDVTNLTVLRLNYSSNVTITNLTGGVDGQCVVLAHTQLLAVVVSINDSGSFSLAGNWSGATDDTLTVCHSNGRWYEMTRSDN